MANPLAGASIFFTGVREELKQVSWPGRDELVGSALVVFVGVAAKHRQAAFEACQFLMDYLKTRAPFWKLEERGGHADWVEARSEDNAATQRWTQK